MAARVEVQGLNKAVRALREVGGAEARKAAAGAQRKAAEVVVHEARPHAPIGGRKQYEGGKDKHPGRLAGTLRTKATANRASVLLGNARAPYAGPIHWGWPSRNIKGQRFVYVSLMKERKNIAKVFQEEFNAVFKKYGLTEQVKAF